MRCIFWKMFSSLRLCFLMAFQLSRNRALLDVVRFFGAAMLRQFICIYFNSEFLLLLSPDGQSDVDVQLVVPRYVERGSSVTFKCKHNVIPEILFKVSSVPIYVVYTILLNQHFPDACDSQMENFKVKSEWKPRQSAIAFALCYFS